MCVCSYGYYNAKILPPQFSLIYNSQSVLFDLLFSCENSPYVVLVKHGT